MKKVVAAILIFAWSTVASAQESEQRGFPMPTVTMCDSAANMTGVLSKYDEVPMLRGEGSMFSTDGQQLTGEMQFWYSAANMTYTVTISNGQIMCMLTSGRALEPVTQGEPL